MGGEERPRQVAVVTRYSTTARAMARPSYVPVPRPISSRTISERGVAWRRIAAVSIISTMKRALARRDVVLRADAGEDAIHEADTRRLRRDKEPICAIRTISATCRRIGALARHVRPGDEES